MVEQIVDLVHTNHKVKTQQMVSLRNRGQWCGNIELPVYRDDAVGSVSLVLDLRITHERWGSRSKPLNDHLYYPRPDDIDRPPHEVL